MNDSFTNLMLFLSYHISVQQLINQEVVAEGVEFQKTVSPKLTALLVRHTVEQNLEELKQRSSDQVDIILYSCNTVWRFLGSCNRITDPRMTRSFDHKLLQKLNRNSKKAPTVSFNTNDNPVDLLLSTGNSLYKEFKTLIAKTECCKITQYESPNHIVYHLIFVLNQFMKNLDEPVVAASSS